MKKLRSGQALVFLLVFVMISIVYTSAAIVIIAVNSSLVTKAQEGERAKNLAESAMEDTLLNLLRVPNYSAMSISFEDGDVTIDIVGDTQKTITATATAGKFVRRVEVTTQLVDNIFTVNSWKEIY
ncbi:hypothetical protein A2630_00995 [Candidatus Woesebacteria bacterium RIFCSPHIGHO2_01_FULL_44_10]|uniref:Uncharacterized protein n=1 Tax=Candidatus Woesebacteria bacterium RIFCSPLOWO2_01_FULL_44_14 TaxID=1802525 RepID=A0A1F8C1H0_9BACT|nr:MAG: hypothetical protein A2630_00995 [Candidatus Woesebacteria bacterium RIFCSPHIGHO2_01_FULL_44_10]OGM54119.1 MAG: hypothetical protein A3F62_05440 [Candidatus Woesebacteria bacterium RIFCSPHIGHO2_12_FULL_44_11]OGM70204.1 MAG: hypothetical protein A2975_03980 [Candidatus Woesebacteria bacterium RIFCSPLOWO2_01_FULL_44_14]